MDMKPPILTADYLTTETDYINTYLAQKRYETKTLDKVITRILGSLIFCCGLVMLIFFNDGGIIKTICWILLVVIGLFLISYHDVIVLAMVRNRAKNEYRANKEKFQTRNIAFFEDRAEIRSERYNGNIPYKYIYKILEDKNVIIIFIDNNDFHAVPKRIFSEEDQAGINRVRQILCRKYVKNK